MTVKTAPTKPAPAKVTPKAQRTRALILETALDLFARKGYAETTLRDIAAEADCSLGLAYRYFARKEEMVLALYERLASELEEEVAGLPALPLAKRFVATMEADLRRLTPHRATMGVLFTAGLAPDSPVAVLGLPPVARPLARLARNVGPMFGPGEPTPRQVAAPPGTGGRA